MIRTVSCSHCKKQRKRDRVTLSPSPGLHGVRVPREAALGHPCRVHLEGELGILTFLPSAFLSADLLQVSTLLLSFYLGDVVRGDLAIWGSSG